MAKRKTDTTPADAAAAGASDAEASDAFDASGLTYEQAVEMLEQIIDDIESGEIGLEESLVRKRHGDALIRRCREILDSAEQDLQAMTAADLPDGSDGSGSGSRGGSGASAGRASGGSKGRAAGGSAGGSGPGSDSEGG